MHRSRRGPPALRFGPLRCEEIFQQFAAGGGQQCVSQWEDRPEEEESRCRSPGEGDLGWKVTQPQHLDDLDGPYTVGARLMPFTVLPLVSAYSWLFKQFRMHPPHALTY